MMPTASLLGGGFCARFALTLAHFLWQGAAIGALAAASTIIVRTPKRRYVVLCVFLLIMAASPVVTFCLTKGASPPTPFVSTSPTRAPLPRAFTQLAPRSVAPTPLPAHPMPSHGSHGRRINFQGLAPYFTIAYAAGLSIMLARLLLGLRGAEHLRSEAVPVTDTSLLAALERKAAALGLACVPAVAHCQRVAVPTVIGLIRPMILLPLAMCNSMSVDQVEMVLAHELAHIRRYDYLVNLTQRFIEALIFFHPAVWLLSRRIRTERELCCDDLAVRAGGQALGYAACLVSLAKNAKAAELPATAAVGAAGDHGRASQLRQRVLRLVEGNTHERHAVSRTWLVAGAVACLGLVGGIGYLQAQEAKGKPKKEPESAAQKQEPERTSSSPIGRTEGMAEQTKGAVQLISERARLQTQLAHLSSQIAHLQWPSATDPPPFSRLSSARKSETIGKLMAEPQRMLLERRKLLVYHTRTAPKVVAIDERIRHAMDRLRRALVEMRTDALRRIAAIDHTLGQASPDNPTAPTPKPSRAPQTDGGGRRRRSRNPGLAVEEALAERLSLNFADTPLTDVLAFLADVTKVNMILDPRALTDAEGPLITLKVEEMPLDQALDAIVRRFARLDFEIVDDAIFITDPDYLHRHDELRTYDVRDVVSLPADRPGTAGTSTERAERLVNAILRSVEPQSWRNATVGSREIEPVGEAEDARASLWYRNGHLIVSQTRTGHRRLDEILGALRGQWRGKEPASLTKIQKTLQDKVTVDFTSTPISDVLAFLHDLSGINFLLDPNAIEGAGPEVSLQAQGMKLETVLDIAVRRFARLNYAIEGDAIVVTDWDIVGDRYELRTYDLRDILTGRPEQGDQTKPAESLARAIVQLVQPDLWEHVTVAGRELPVPTEAEDALGRLAAWDDRLVVWQTRSAHDEIATFLANLRKTGTPTNARTAPDAPKSKTSSHSVGTPSRSGLQHRPIIDMTDTPPEAIIAFLNGDAPADLTIHGLQHENGLARLRAEHVWLKDAWSLVTAQRGGTGTLTANRVLSVSRSFTTPKRPLQAYDVRRTVQSPVTQDGETKPRTERIAKLMRLIVGQIALGTWAHAAIRTTDGSQSIGILDRPHPGAKGIAVYHRGYLLICHEPGVHMLIPAFLSQLKADRRAATEPKPAD